ncbi:MAG: endolytic transglycosylase MltG [Acidimicrobiales bacterium]
MTFDDRNPTSGPADDIWTTDPSAESERPGRVGAAPSAPRRGPRRPARPTGASTPPGRPPRAPRRAADDDEWVELPAEGRVPRWAVALLVVGALVALAVLGGRWWYRSQVDPPGPPGSVVAIVVPEGTTSSGVAKLMADEGVITNSTLFNLWVNGKGLDSVQAGTYELREDMSFREAVDALNAGPESTPQVATTKVTIPEGYTVAQIVARIAEQVPRLTVEDLQGALDRGEVQSALQPEGSTNYEGLLFPATYEVTDEDTAVDVLDRMAAEMDARAAQLGLDDAAATLSAETGEQLDAYDLLTIASLVQEEAGSAEEAPKIARVITNRLREGWALGIDATSRYLASIEGGDIDLESDSPYNTRLQVGLPPTPIASPGAYALEAAAAPEAGPWMYYVLTDPGVHTFAVTDAEFQRAKQECIAKDLGCG